MDLQNITVTVDLGDGNKWVYQNICSINTNERFINDSDPNSIVFSLNVDSTNVSVKRIEENNNSFVDEISNKLNYIISKLENTQHECCKKKCNKES